MHIDVFGANVDVDHRRIEVLLVALDAKLVQGQVAGERALLDGAGLQEHGQRVLEQLCVIHSVVFHPIFNLVKIVEEALYRSRDLNMPRFKIVFEPFLDLLDHFFAGPGDKTRCGADVLDLRLDLHLIDVVHEVFHFLDTVAAI